MRQRERLATVLALWCALPIGAFAVSGCSDDRTTTGTTVQRTPEEVASEKASMEGMRKAMMSGQGKGQAKPK
jgi:hypothetical protein